MTLREITDDIATFAAWLDDETMADETMANALHQSLSVADEMMQSKLDSIATVLSSMHDDAASIKAEIDRLTERRKRIDKNVDRLMGYTQYAMDKIGRAKIGTPTYTFVVVSNPPRIDVDESLLPSEYMRQKITLSPDKASIKAAITRGESVPGATMVQDKKLRIK
jgi:hypothetical protein